MWEKSKTEVGERAGHEERERERVSRNGGEKVARKPLNKTNYNRLYTLAWSNVIDYFKM